MKKVICLITACFVFFISSILTNDILHSEVVWEDPSKPNGITLEQWKKYKSKCDKQLNRETDNNFHRFPQSQKEHLYRECIQNIIGANFLQPNKKGGWHPKISQTRNGKPYVKPWDYKNPRKFNAYQYALGKYITNCKKDCDNFENGYYGGNHRTKESCLIDEAQCEEQVEKTVCIYKYWVIGVENCYPEFYWDWDSDKVYQWLLPDALMGKGGEVVGCLRPLAEYLNNCNACASLIRCQKVCKIDYRTLSFTGPDYIKPTNSPQVCEKNCRIVFDKLVNPMDRSVPRECPGEFYRRWF